MITPDLLDQQWCDTNQIQLTLTQLREHLGTEPDQAVLAAYMFSVGISSSEFRVTIKQPAGWVAAYAPGRFTVYDFRFADATCLALARLGLGLR